MSVEELEARWPELGAAARVADLTDFLATALFATGDPVGSLNLYSHNVIPTLSSAVTIVTMLADYLSRALGDLESVAVTHEFGAAAARAHLIADAKENAVSVLDYARKILSSFGSR